MTGVEREAIRFEHKDIGSFLEFLSAKNRSAGTLEKYARDLQTLYNFLPEEKSLTEQTLLQWQAWMVEQGYAVRTINGRLSAANSFLEYRGRRDLQLLSMDSPEDTPQAQELTRQEYLRLLSTARILAKERVYLWVKVFGSTGIRVQSLSAVTRESVEAGFFEEGERCVRFPEGLRKELRAYADREGILRGSLFLSQNGEPVRRTYVTDSIRALGREARVQEEKATPRCLQRMFRRTQRELQERVTRLVEQSYEHLLEAEQLTIGWSEN